MLVLQDPCAGYALVEHAYVTSAGSVTEGYVATWSQTLGRIATVHFYGLVEYGDAEGVGH